MSALDDFLNKAVEQIGYKEGPNNDNKYGEYFNDNFESWCCYFICWCADQEGLLTYSEDADCPYIPFSASVTKFDELYDENRRLLEPKMDPSSNNYPMPGDLVAIQYDGYSSPNHIGIVYEVNGNTLTTIEGNCSDSVRTATYTNLDGGSFGKIKYLLSNHKSY